MVLEYGLSQSYPPPPLTLLKTLPLYNSPPNSKSFFWSQNLLSLSAKHMKHGKHKGIQEERQFHTIAHQFMEKILLDFLTYTYCAINIKFIVIMYWHNVFKTSLLILGTITFWIFPWWAYLVGGGRVKNKIYRGSSKKVLAGKKVRVTKNVI